MGTTVRPYNDPDYRAARHWLSANPDTRCTCPGCHRCNHPHGCTRNATTIDHRPALMHHQHQRGAGCCTLHPACRACNCSTGASEGNAKREPSSGWLR